VNDAELTDCYSRCAWPLVVFATDNSCYIADTINRRVLKAALDYEVMQSQKVSL